MRSLKSCDNEFCDIYSLTLNMPMDADFAIAFVAGNIDRDSRIKKKFIPKSQLGQGINIFVKILYICTHYTECQLFLESFQLTPFLFLFSLVKESDLLSV